MFHLIWNLLAIHWLEMSILLYFFTMAARFLILQEISWNNIHKEKEKPTHMSWDNIIFDTISLKTNIYLSSQSQISTSFSWIMGTEVSSLLLLVTRMYCCFIPLHLPCYHEFLNGNLHSAYTNCSVEFLISVSYHVNSVPSSLSLFQNFK